ncbi:unnamed protein product [Sphagnum balticum]
MSRDDHVFLIILQRTLTLFRDLRLHTPNFCRERGKYAKELEVQAIEYKTIIQHHLSVNNKLLKEKQALAEKCCNLAANLATAESKFEEKTKQMSEQWTREMTKAKEIWIAGEKARQKAWVEWKTKQIREKQKILIQRLEIKHAEELQKQLEAQALDHRRHLELRERLQQVPTVFFLQVSSSSSSLSRFLHDPHKFAMHYVPPGSFETTVIYYWTSS